MKHIALLTLCCSLLLPLGAAADQAVDRTAAAAANGTVDIENLSGSLRIEGWDRGEVKITGSLGDDVEELQVRSEGNRTSIRVKLPEGNQRGNKDFNADLVIKVPRNSSLSAETVSSSIGVSGVYGKVELQTVSGKIEASGEPRQLEIDTVSGEIRADVRTDDVDLETVNGKIHLDGSFRKVEVNSVSSDLELSLGTTEQVSVQSVSGNLAISADPGAAGRLEIQAHSGNVDLTLPAGIAADFSVTTFSGEIKNDFGPPARRNSEFAPGKSLEFSTGNGARVKVQSFSGGVHLIKG